MTEEISNTVTAVNNDTEIKVEVVATEQPETTTIEPEVKPEVKTTRKKKKVEEPKQEIEVQLQSDSASNNTELEELKKELELMKSEKTKLEEERNSLNETVLKLQEEVKITPQKLGQAIKEMGISPLSTIRENNNQMNIESYNAMSDSQRREWQRTHRVEYLNMLHNVKISY